MLERLDGLIRRKATGSREELAERLGVSVRTVTSLKQELEDFGAEICFDRISNSYVYCNHIRFTWKLGIELNDANDGGGIKK